MLLIFHFASFLFSPLWKEKRNKNKKKRGLFPLKKKKKKKEKKLELKKKENPKKMDPIVSLGQSNYPYIILVASALMCIVVMMIGTRL